MQRPGGVRPLPPFHILSTCNPKSNIDSGSGILKHACVSDASRTQNLQQPAGARGNPHLGT